MRCLRLRLDWFLQEPLLHLRMLCQLLLEKLPKQLVIHVPPPTLLGVRPASQIGLIYSSYALLLACHKWNSRSQHSPYVPACSPCLFVVVCETRAYWFVSLKSATWCVKQQLRRSKRIFIIKLKYSMIKSTLVNPIEPINTKVKFQKPFTGYNNVRDRLLFKTALFLLKAHDC